jgi:hypothetical protein
LDPEAVEGRSRYLAELVGITLGLQFGLQATVRQEGASGAY